MSIFVLFYHAHSSNMVMLRVTQVVNVEKFNIWPKSAFNFRKNHSEFLVEKISVSEVISQKPQGWGCMGNTFPILLGLKGVKPPFRIT